MTTIAATKSVLATGAESVLATGAESVLATGEATTSANSGNAETPQAKAKPWEKLRRRWNERTPSGQLLIDLTDHSESDSN